MIIGIDIRCLLEKYYSGISEYTFGLVNTLFKIDTVNKYKLFYNSSKIVKLPAFSFPNVAMYGFRYPNRLLNLSMCFLKYPKIDYLLSRVDVMFFPSFLFASWSKNCKTILNVHDLSFVSYPSFFTLKSRLWANLIHPRKICQTVNTIVAVSKNTKNDIIRYYHVPQNKIHILYPGIDERYKVVSDVQKLDIIKRKYNLLNPFILYLGNIEPRKNINSLISAFEILYKENFPKTHIELILAGNASWRYQAIFKQVRKSKIKNRIRFLGYVTKEDKPLLYNLAELFVYPSYFEGFGFPPLEAMACGTPVIVSHTSSLPEVVEGSAFMVDPYNTYDIAMGMKRILTDKTLQNEYIQRGLQQVKKFTWIQCANNFLKILNQIQTS